MTTTPRRTALLDQVHAAAGHARRVLATAAGNHDATGIPVTPPWLRPHVQALTRALAADTGCPHAWDGPQILHAAVWAPGRVVCSHCVHTLAPPPGEDHTCDRCRQAHPVIHSGAAAAGPVLLAFGICRPCLNATNPGRTPINE
jgi:hypothetical protein